MVRLAVAVTPGWEVWELELTREGPSYTFDTLTTVAAEGVTPLQIFFITGADAFAEIATWHRYPEVLDRAHFVVVSRPGTTLPSLKSRLPQLASRMCEPARVAGAEETRIILLEADTPDVSATDIRRRVATGESIEGLVPGAVSAYIARNLLYRTVPGAQIA
jgi:nicotinate-nucleotide adenylyltransferase